MPGFQDILGHEGIKEHLLNAVNSGKVSHAYILSGEKGTGKKMIANAFALTLLCEKKGEEPCLECHSCKQVLSEAALEWTTLENKFRIPFRFVPTAALIKFILWTRRK